MNNISNPFIEKYKSLLGNYPQQFNKYSVFNLIGAIPPGITITLGFVVLGSIMVAGALYEVDVIHLWLAFSLSSCALFLITYFYQKSHNREYQKLWLDIQSELTEDDYKWMAVVLRDLNKQPPFKRLRKDSGETQALTQARYLLMRQYPDLAANLLSEDPNTRAITLAFILSPDYMAVPIFYPESITGTKGLLCRDLNIIFRQALVDRSNLDALESEARIKEDARRRLYELKAS